MNRTVLLNWELSSHSFSTGTAMGCRVQANCRSQ
jgi:hypothetical protein